MAKILVFGASGILGTVLVPFLRAQGHEVVSQGRRPPIDICIDPTDPEIVSEVLRREKPNVIVNMIAATNVDYCEEHPSKAFLVNVRVVETITSAIQDLLPEYRSHLIQISTDQVYDGPGPHQENDPLPGNIYALTKFASELVAEKVQATVLRTNFVGRSRCHGRTTLCDWIVNSLRELKQITVFDDVWFSPLHLSTLCALIAGIVMKPIPGIFNAGCSDGISKADFAYRLASILGLNVQLLKTGKSSNASFKANRPLDMRLDVTRTEKSFKFIAPTIEGEIQRTAEEYLNAKTCYPDDH